MTHSYWSHSAVSRRCVQIIISNQSGNHANQYPYCNFWKYCSVPRSCSFSEWDVENYWIVARCHITVLRVFVRVAVSLLGYMGIYWRWSPQKKKVPPSVSWGERVFSQHPGSRWGWSGELDALCFSARPRTFSSSYISLPKPEPSALVSCDIRWWVLGQPIPLWSSFSRIPSVSWMQQNTSLSPTRRKTDGKLGHVHCTWRGWLETHKIYHMRPVLRVPVLVLGCQHAVAAAMVRSQFGASVWMSWAISSCY